MINNVLGLMLSPLLFAQGKWARWRTPKLPEPQGARMGVEGEGDSLTLFIVGDSAAAGVGVEQQQDALLGQLVMQLAPQYCVNYQLIATTGHTTLDCLADLQRFEPTPVDVVLTSLGVNDLTSGKSIAQFKHHQQQLVHCLRKRFSAQHIILSGMPPMHQFFALPQPLRWIIGNRAQSFDATIQTLAREEGTLYLPVVSSTNKGEMATDGFHPSASVYQAWAAVAANLINSELRA